jgi:hypothetical protein
VKNKGKLFIKDIFHDMLAIETSIDYDKSGTIKKKMGTMNNEI